jgi:LPS export ABC transporter protein LptC
MYSLTKPIFLCMISMVICLAACDKNNISTVNKVTKKEKNTETSYGVEAIYSDSAHIKAKLKSPKMVRFLDDNIIEMPKGLEVLFYNKLMQVNSKLTAKYGIRYLNKNLTVVEGNVVVVNTKGDTLNTEKLTWYENGDSVRTNKFVRVKSSTSIILADSLKTNTSFSDYQFYHVRGSIQLKK